MMRRNKNVRIGDFAFVTLLNMVPRIVVGITT